MVNILLKYLQFNQIYFLSKIRLKVQTYKVLYNNDNYLNLNTAKELSRYKNFAAYLKLIYVLRYNKARNFIKKNYFLKFKEVIKGWVSEKKCFLKKFVIKVILK